MVLERYRRGRGESERECDQLVEGIILKINGGVDTEKDLRSATKPAIGGILIKNGECRGRLSHFQEETQQNRWPEMTV